MVCGAIGEIVASGHNIMQGYWKDPAATAGVLKDQGLWTGDLARMAEEGYLYIVSRKSDMIKSGAHRIGPKEIEDILMEHDAVIEAAVFGVEDELLGEAIAACAVCKAGAACTEKELRLHCKNCLPAFKVPHHIIFASALPKTTTGKIQKNELKKACAAALSDRNNSSRPPSASGHEP